MWSSVCSAFPWFTDVLGRLACGMLSISVRPSLRDLLQSLTRLLDSVSSPKCVLLRILAGFTFYFVINSTIMPQATAEGTTCSFLMITVRQKAGRHAVMRYSAYRHLSLTVSKVMLFNTWEKSPLYICSPFVFSRNSGSNDAFGMDLIKPIFLLHRFLVIQILCVI